MPRVKLFDEEKILYKAMMLFWQNGYASTSIQDLLDQLEISRSSLYDTFGGKKKLFKRTLILYRSSQKERLQRFIDSQTDVKAALRGMFKKVIDDDTTGQQCKGCFVVNTTTELVPGAPHIQSILVNHRQEMEGIFLRLLQKGVDTGQVSEGNDLPALARLIYTLLSGIRVVGKTKIDPKEMMASIDKVMVLLDF